MGLLSGCGKQETIQTNSGENQSPAEEESDVKEENEVQAENVINEEEYDENLLGELMVYDEICKQPNRKGCALIPVRAIDKVLEVFGYGNK